MTDMSNLFRDCPTGEAGAAASLHTSEFNADISAWDTSQVTNMGMFMRPLQPRHRIVEYRAGHEHEHVLCTAFNQDIGSWNTAQVTTWGHVLMAPPRSTKTSDRGIPRRSRHASVAPRVQPRHRIVDTAQVTTWHVLAPRSTKTSDRGIPRRSRTWGMFMAPPRSTKTSDRGIPRRSRTWVHVHGAAAFNQDIGSWNTAQVTTCGHVQCAAFNKHRIVDTAQVTTMQAMFRRLAFNQDIGSWNTAQVTTMRPCSNALPRSTKISDRGIPRRSRHGACSDTPPRSTMISPAGQPPR